MKVSELIELLKTLPQEAEVLTWDRISGAYDDLKKDNIMLRSGGMRVFL